jgi:hypothetical protein
LYRITVTILRLLDEWEHKRRVSGESALELLKTVCLLLAAAQLIRILAIYVALGHLCLALGGGALAVSANRHWVKLSVPVLAPHAVQLDQLVRSVSQHAAARDGLGRLSALASAAVEKALSSALGGAPTHTQTQPQFARDPRVEELVDEPPPPPPSSIPSSARPPKSTDAVEDNDDYVFPEESSSSVFPAQGLRQRTKGGVK